MGRALREKRHLEVLALKKNDISFDGLSELQNVLQNSKTIRELDLSGNHIGDEGVKIVTQALMNKQKQNLHSLSLAENEVSNQGCNLICELFM